MGTGFSVYEGLHQEHKANQIQKNLKTPQYQIPAEFYANRNIARQLAQLGLPSAQYNNNLNQINANQANATAAASRSANPGSAIPAIQGQTNSAINNLNAEDAQARDNNERFYVNENGQLGGQKLQQQQANVFDPYTRDFNLEQSYRGAGLQNLNTAFQDIGSLGNIAAQYGLYNPNTTPQAYGQVTNSPQIATTAPANGIASPQLQNTLPGYMAPGNNLKQPLYADWNLQYQ